MYKKIVLLLLISSSLYAGIRKKVSGGKGSGRSQSKQWFQEELSDHLTTKKAEDLIAYRMKANQVAQEKIRGCCGAIRLIVAAFSSIGGDEYGNDYPIPGEGVGTDKLKKKEN